MKKGKKLAAILLAFCMAAGVAAGPAVRQNVQAETIRDGDYQYTQLDNGTVEITRYSGADAAVTIPGELGGWPVSSIGEHAFSYRANITELTIPDSVANIGQQAFLNCTGISQITLPANVANIKTNAFAGCTRLAEIQADSANAVYASDDGVLYNKAGTELLICPEGKTGVCDVLAGVSSIGGSAFWNCTGLTGVTLPGGVASIGASAFYGCSSLRSIDVPAGAGSIGSYAFYGCESLTEMTVPNHVSSIERGTFQGCTSLRTVTLPAGIQVIGEEAFAGCSSLSGVYYAGNQAQWDTVRISEGGSGNGPLLNATLYFRDGSILNGPEEDYEWRVISSGAISITAYNGPGGDVRIPEELLGKRVVEIEEDAFRDNARLKTVTIPYGVVQLGDRIFSDCPNLTGIYADSGNASYTCEDGVLFNKAKTELIKYPGGKTGNYRIPDGVAEIKKDAFAQCTRLTGITMPDGLGKIGAGAFRGCTSLAAAAISDGMQEIGAGAFEGCTSLAAAVIPDSVQEIGGYAFAGCSSLTAVTLPGGIKQLHTAAFLSCGNLTELKIPDSVAHIHPAAFEACTNLAAISLPAGIVSIEGGAAHLCPRLKDIYYDGTREQWEKVQIATDGHSYTDGEPFTGEYGGNGPFFTARIHFNDGTVLDGSKKDDLQSVMDARQELQNLKNGDALGLEQALQQYLSAEQIDVAETYLYLWLADVNYAYQYPDGTVRKMIMKKVGLDADGDVTSGTEKAITHIIAETNFGKRTIEFTLDLGKPDEAGNLYPSYGSIYYEILEKDGIPAGMAAEGQIGKDSYLDMAAFIGSIQKASDDSLHNTYRWESLSDDMTAGVLIDKTVVDLIGVSNGSFADGVLTVYGQPVRSYKKKVTIACPVDVYVYDMDGNQAGSVIHNQVSMRDANINIQVNGDTKTVFMTESDYYLELKGTDTGTMQYQVEEMVDEQTRRTVQFLELQLKEDLSYIGYVFRPLNIDSNMYALRKKDTNEVVTTVTKDTYESLFKRIQGLSLSQQNTSLTANKTVQLSASLFPLDASNPDLQWMTDNASVAKVDGSGLVTAVSAGRATVTAATKDGSFLKQFCIIDVADVGSNSGGSSGGSSGGYGGSSGWPGGGSAPAVEQEKNPVVVKLHYVVQFDRNGGTNLSRRTMTLLKDDAPGIMPKVQRKDYLFDGWYTQKEGGAKVAGDQPLTEAATLYARWIKVQAPGKTASLTLKSAKKGQIQAVFQSVKDAAGYQIDYSTSKKFTSKKTKEAGAAAKTKTLTGLKAGKKYYVRVRAYRIDSMGNRIYGVYSGVKNVKVKE